MSSPASFPSAEELRLALLNDLRFEDDQGLWEVVWRLNTISPEVEQERKLALAREVVFQLVEAGEVELRSAKPGEGAQLLPDSEVACLRNEAEPWCDPERTDLLVLIRAAE